MMGVGFIARPEIHRSDGTHQDDIVEIVMHRRPISVENSIHGNGHTLAAAAVPDPGNATFIDMSREYPALYFYAGWTAGNW